MANLEELVRLMNTVLFTRTRAEWIELFDAAGVPVGPVHSIGEAMTHPQTLARGMVVETQHPAAGATKAIGCPVHFSETPTAVTRPAPLLGEHTREVLRELRLQRRRDRRLRRRRRRRDRRLNAWFTRRRGARVRRGSVTQALCPRTAHARATRWIEPSSRIGAGSTGSARATRRVVLRRATSRRPARDPAHPGTATRSRRSRQSSLRCRSAASPRRAIRRRDEQFPQGSGRHIGNRRPSSSASAAGSSGDRRVPEAAHQFHLVRRSPRHRPQPCHRGA